MDSVNTPSAESLKRTAQTLIFFDLESTGLPFSVGKKNVHITELSLIAVDRTEFESNEDIRIINKLSLTIRPRSNISFEAIHMTGLCNTALQFQEYFNESTAKLLELFFQRLNQPICLLAHNGRRFDFPLLQAELNNVGAMLGDSIYCADTLDAFREILSRDENSTELDTRVVCAEPLEHDRIHHPTIKDAVVHTTDPAKSCAQYYDVNTLTFDHIERILCQDMDVFENLKSEEELQRLCTPPTNTDTNVVIVNAKEDNSLLLDNNIFSQLNEKTPLNKISSVPIKLNRCKLPAAEPVTPDNSQKTHSSVRRNLFKESTVVNSLSQMTKTNKSKKKNISFSLENLYRYFFKSDLPVAHFAEADCMSLMKISCELRDFVLWIDDHMILFNSVHPMW